MQIGPWLTATETSRLLGVSEQTLNRWREVGYLKPGTHWRKAPQQLSPGLHSPVIPWVPEVVYHFQWCKEEMDYWKDHDAQISIAA